MKPVLFIDFDRTIFDTSILDDALGEDTASRMAEILGGRATDPDYAAMLYADTRRALGALREAYHLILLTHAGIVWSREFQRRKVERSGVAAMVDEVIITMGMKGEEARAYFEKTGTAPEGTVFLDDLPEQISDMKARIPASYTVLMVRNPAIVDSADSPPFGADAVVQNLDQFVDLLCARTG